MKRVKESPPTVRPFAYVLRSSAPPSLSLWTALAGRYGVSTDRVYKNMDQHVKKNPNPLANRHARTKPNGTGGFGVGSGCTLGSKTGP